MKKISLLINTSLLVLALAPLSEVLAKQDTTPSHKLDFVAATNNTSKDQNQGATVSPSGASVSSPFDPRRPPK